MRHLVDVKRSQPKEKIISIRIAEDQREIFHAAMIRLELPSLSRFARIAMLKLAERILRPTDLAKVRLVRGLAAKSGRSDAGFSPMNRIARTTLNPCTGGKSRNYPT